MHDALYPVAFDSSVPAAGAAAYLADDGITRVVDFFRTKGLATLKQEDRAETWYQDWVDYEGKHRLYASLLSPAAYSSLGHRLNLRRYVRFIEAFAYHAPAQAYSLHVTFLGLFPILMSDNEALKREAIARLEAGGLFAFGVSEREHGSDLLSTSFRVAEAAPGEWIADGSKYYIGNANAAAMISILAKVEGGSAAGRRAPFVFFVLRPAETRALTDVQKIRTLGIRPAFVASFSVSGHRFPEGDILSRGREAWDAVFNTVDLGKFFLGFGAVGICEHAFAEARQHLAARGLYGKPALDMAHLRTGLATAYARLAAMKFYAYRALDYLQACREDDRRYLLLTAVQKAKVSTEGVKVMSLLSECVGAWGFEAETYFESALRDVQLIPGLEGSTHINYGQTAQFIEPYFSATGTGVQAPDCVCLRDEEPGENPYWLQARDRTARSVRFGHCLHAYRPLRHLPNVRAFMRQVRTFRAFATAVRPNPDRAAAQAENIALGRAFAVVVYGQLVAEMCGIAQAPAPLVSLAFHALVEDLAAEALRLAAMSTEDPAARAALRRVIQVPATPASDVKHVADFINSRYAT